MNTSPSVPPSDSISMRYALTAIVGFVFGLFAVLLFFVTLFQHFAF